MQEESSMTDFVFQEAYGRVRGRHSDQEWFTMTPRQITEAIYEEIRLVDQERARSSEPAALLAAE
jgi:hypothetical protein